MSPCWFGLVRTAGLRVMPLSDEQKAARAEKCQLARALETEARAHLDEVRRCEWCEEGMHLAREQAVAGEPYRGCGLPEIDNLGSWPATMYLSPEERIAYDEAEARYENTHSDCNTHRWSTSGSRAMRCAFCCPPIRLSDPQLENITRISTNFKARHEGRGIWERTLTCGHRVQQSVHHTNSTPSFNLVSSIGDDHSAVLGCGAHRELGEPPAAEDVGGRP